MILEEGRNRQIRRMFEKLDNEVVTLHRFMIGNLTLGELAQGKWCILSKTDIKKLI